MDGIILEIYTRIIEGDLSLTLSNVKLALDQRINPAEILNEGMVAAMKEVGRRFEEGDFYVPEMLISARAMQAGLFLLRPLLQQNHVKATGKVAIGTVKGDLHDIGKNLVGMMLEGSGFEVLDLGVDVTPEKVVATVREYSPDILALSALLTTTMPMMKLTLDALQKAGLRQKVKVIVGGAPITPAFAVEIGADGSAADASRAVSLALSLLRS